MRFVHTRLLRIKRVRLRAIAPKQDLRMCTSLSAVHQGRIGRAGAGAERYRREREERRGFETTEHGSVYGPH